MNANPSPILATIALPYANGPIHLGHMVEHIQGDIWVRAMRMHGRRVHFVCADDSHGTPIMLRAEGEGLEPEQLIERIWQQHTADFRDFGIEFDHYGTTHSATNQQLTYRIWQALREQGAVAEQDIEQFFDPQKQMFLPDRYVKGECPHCQTKDQYGDSCEACGNTYAPTDLKQPYSVLSGKTPELRRSKHYFVRLQRFEADLRAWLDARQQADRLQGEVRNKLEEWFKEGLRDWDVSRDAPYFGFKIPDTDDKFFYVWMDAPVGYLATFQELCRRDGLDFEAFMKPGAHAEMVHFIGKDITYFHTLFWPAMLMAAGFRTPDAVFVHGFLTVQGQKMSKSRGTFINARTYLDHLHPDYLRYYLATLLNPSLADVDFDLTGFEQRVNSHLVGKFANIASRCAKLLETHFSNRLGHAFWETTPGAPDYERAHAQALAAVTDLIRQACARYPDREYSRATQTIMAAADLANEFVNRHAPWALAKDPQRRAELHVILTAALNMFRAIACALKPVIPRTIEAAERFLALPPGGFRSFEELDRHLSDHTLTAFIPLLTRVDPQALAKLVQVQSPGAQTKPDSVPAPASNPQPAAPQAATAVSIEQFSSIDLRIARIVDAQPVPEADKLLRLTLDLGGERKQVFAGIKGAYAAADLVNRLTVMVANLAPRKMRFGISEGMVLAASDERGGPFLLSPDSGAQPGMRVK